MMLATQNNKVKGAVAQVRGGPVYVSQRGAAAFFNLAFQMPDRALSVSGTPFGGAALFLVQTTSTYMALSDKYKEMKAAEEKASILRKEIIDELQLKRKEAPRGYTKKIANEVPKYDTLRGSSSLNHALNGKSLDPDVLAAMDRIVPDEPEEQKSNQ